VRVLYSAENLVISLPDDLDGYLASFGGSTRRNLRTYQNRVRRDFPDPAFARGARRRSAMVVDAARVRGVDLAAIVRSREGSP
jgi:hypothetical protein